MLLKISRLILSVLLLSLSAYSLITKDFRFLSLMNLFLGGLMIVMGIDEFQKNRRSFMGFLFIGASMFGFYVALQGFLLN